MTSYYSDYKKWLTLSSCSYSADDAKLLFQAVEKLSSNDLLQIEKLESEVLIYLNGSDTLTLKMTEREEFLNYLEAHYIPSSTPVPNEGAELKDKRLTKESELTKVLDKSLLLLSSENKLRHSFKFSILLFMLLQIAILPQFVSLELNKTFSYTYVTCIVTGISYLSIWSYSRYVKKLTNYWDIFRIVFLSCFLTFSAIVIQVTLIDNALGKEFSVLFVSFFFFLEGFVALVVSVFLTAIFYLIQGGKIVNIKNE